ncbi:hypothetical protein [Chryseolinea sp. H1M3-3]|uniref:hypothetical protein n=1 Tax=Chryseolinea sp. H1M3-3 TaxID=3034144 RepID=UPI0023EA8935|nr:hypothetical protein [Chryseolinea sp. H1M3-3]
MKLLLVTSLKEDQKKVIDIMNIAGVDAFSLSNAVGFKNHRKPVLLDNWFGSGDEQADAIFLFSFTDESKTEEALHLIRHHNAQNKNGFPIRAFVLPVEKSTYEF